MGTLSNDEFSYHLNMALVEKQFSASKSKNSITNAEFKGALKLYQKGNSCLESRDYQKAHESFTHALELIMGKGIIDLEASCLFFLSILLLSCGEENGALQGFNLAFNNAEDNLLKLSILNRMSIYYLSKNNSKKVHEITDLSLALTNQLEESNHTKYYKAASNFNKSEAYVRDYEYDDALPYIRAANEQFIEIGLTLESAKCDSLLGLIYTWTKKYEDALPYLLNAFKIYKKYNDDDEMTALLRNIGHCYLGIGEKKKGLSKLKEALTYAQRIGNAEHLNMLLAEISGIEAM